jgi:hypothetical protein
MERMEGRGGEGTGRKGVGNEWLEECGLLLGSGALHHSRRSTLDPSILGSASQQLV